MVSPIGSIRNTFSDRWRTLKTDDAPAEVQDIENEELTLLNAQEELTELGSQFGRLRGGRQKTADGKDEARAAILGENADENYDSLFAKIGAARSVADVLRYARALFPDDIDIALAMRSMIFSRKLRAEIKTLLEGALLELEAHLGETQIEAAMNIGPLARRFSRRKRRKGKLRAEELRLSYLQFIETEPELTGTFIYEYWIDTFGFDNRELVLTFVMNALIADIKSAEPGVQEEEFGPLTQKLISARSLNTMDIKINEKISGLNFWGRLKNGTFHATEEDILRLYIRGLLEAQEFEDELEKFSHNFLQGIRIEERAVFIQTLKSIYQSTPPELFTDESFSPLINDFFMALLGELFRLEKRHGKWKGVYK